MPYEVNNTKKDFRRIWDGLAYHMHEMSKFMVEHKDDPYFETEEGKAFEDLALNITKSHVIGCIRFMTMDLKETIENGLKHGIEEEDKKDSEEKRNPNMEDALKELFGNMGNEG